jgi:5-methylcytosine-specific restriction enzyme subunit McrC
LSTTVTIREYARLTTALVPPDNLDCARISGSAFEWLCTLSASFSNNGARLLQVEGRTSLKWDSYVGVVQTPCGTRIEILPKHYEEGDCLLKSRSLLVKLIKNAFQLKPRKAEVAGLELFDAPLTEWVIAQFLNELDTLVKRGLRFDYQRIEEEQRFLRGQLNVVAQMRQPPGRQHHFQVRHDVFLPDRPENRLLKLALEWVSKSTADAANWRLANELRGLMAEIPASRQVSQDLRLWSRDRLMAHYQAIKPWCELILNQQMPIAVSGQWQGISLLFPMEKLFEAYVETYLRNQLLPVAGLRAQSRSAQLCQHQGQGMFNLIPDFLVDTPEQRWILDTKWKRLNSHDKGHKYNISQSDFYQLYAYGHKYRNGSGIPVLGLIYPHWSGLKKCLDVFDFGDEMRLWVLPFDLDNDVLIDAHVLELPLNTDLSTSTAARA